MAAGRTAAEEFEARYGRNRTGANLRRPTLQVRSAREGISGRLRRRCRSPRSPGWNGGQKQNRERRALRPAPRMLCRAQRAPGQEGRPPKPEPRTNRPVRWCRRSKSGGARPMAAAVQRMGPSGDSAPAVISATIECAAQMGLERQGPIATLTCRSAQLALAPQAFRITSCARLGTAPPLQGRNRPAHRRDRPDGRLSRCSGCPRRRGRAVFPQPPPPWARDLRA